jgi:hypothetical protein
MLPSPMLSQAFDKEMAMGQLRPRRQITFFKKKLALNIQMLDAGEKFTLRGELLP